jgi:hypothetical protein
MRDRLNNHLWIGSVSLLAVLAVSCTESQPPVSSESPAPDPALLARGETSRPIPRRTSPLVITNVPEPVAAVPAVSTNAPAATNTAPVITCTAPQILPCTTADGTELTFTAHVEDADGNALSVVWNVDGKDRYTHQVPAGGPPTSAEVTYAYALTQGDHVVKVTVLDGALSATCEMALSVQADTVEPVIACPQDITVRPDPGQCSAVVTFNPTATDNCPGVVLAADPPSGSAFPIGSTVVTCTATDTAGNVSQCTFVVTVQVTNRCPQIEAYWRQRPGAWPVNSVQIGSQVYTKSQLLPILRATVPADASMVLARQLIAACLNTANGSDPRPICQELAQAHGALSAFSSKLPYRVNTSSAAGRAMNALATRLGAYNSGILTPNCVP